MWLLERLSRSIRACRYQAQRATTPWSSTSSMKESPGSKRKDQPQPRFSCGLSPPWNPMRKVVLDVRSPRPTCLHRSGHDGGVKLPARDAIIDPDKLRDYLHAEAPSRRAW